LSNSTKATSRLIFGKEGVLKWFYLRLMFFSITVRKERASIKIKAWINGYELLM